ncbi:hypothetical protein CR513_20683, partial [Mucuna pruriens]
MQRIYKEIEREERNRSTYRQLTKLFLSVRLSCTILRWVAPHASNSPTGRVSPFFGFVKVQVKGFVVLCCVVFDFDSSPLRFGRWIRGTNVVKEKVEGVMCEEGLREREKEKDRMIASLPLSDHLHELDSVKFPSLYGNQEYMILPEYCAIRLVVSLVDNNSQSTKGKVAFRHSNIGLEPESQSFVFNDDDQISAGYKLQNQKVKECENVAAFIENNEQGLDSSQYDMEPADCMATPKLDFANNMIGMKNECEAQVRDLVEPVSHSSKDIESFMKFPNDIESVQRSPTSPISNPAEERDSSGNSVDAFMEKIVTECAPHLEVCYKESTYHVVKDICVDEGVLTKAKVMFVNTVDEKAHNFIPSESDENKENQKDKTSINVLNLPPTEESDKVSANLDQPKDLMHKDEDTTGKVSGNVSKDIPLPEDRVLLQDLLAQDSVSSDDKIEQISDEPELHFHSEESKNTVEEAILASPSMALANDESNNNSMLPENGTFTHQLDPSAPADCGKEECHQVGSCKCDETQHAFKPVEAKSDDQVVTSHIRHSLGESSFSAIGPVSGRISYSGPVPYSGSISLRSDSSTTSTRSFAFPIIQSEWNSSPVRMAKADRKFRKRRCWKDSFLC